MAGRFEFIDEPTSAVQSPVNQQPVPQARGRIEFLEEAPAAKPSISIPSRSPEQQARDTQQAKEAYEKMLWSGRSPAEKHALALYSSYGQGMLPGVFEWIPAAAAKGLGALGVPGYEQAAAQTIPEIRERAKGLASAAQSEYPKTSTTGTIGGIAGGIATLPAVTRLPIIGQLGAKTSAGLTSGLYGGISGGAEDASLSGAAKGTLLGTGLGFAASPIVEKGLSALTTLFKGGRPVIDASGHLTDEALDVARQAGLSDQKIMELYPHLVETFEQRGLTPAAAREAQFREFGVEPKRGMVSEDPLQLKREIQYGDYGPFAEQASQAAERFVGGPQAPLREAIDAAVARGIESAKALKGQYEQAYEAAAKAPGAFERPAITNVGDKLLSNLAKDESALAFRGSKVVQDAAKHLNETLGASLPIITEQGPASVVHRSFRAVEEARKGLNQYYGAATDKTDRAGMRRLIEEFDQHVEDSINNGAFSGDRSVVDKWRQGRKLFSEYQNKYGYKKSGEESGQLLRQIIDGQKTPEAVGNMMFNFANTGDAQAKSSALGVFRQMERALGRDAPELNNIRGSFLQQLMTPTIKEGEKATPKAFADTAKRIDQFLNGPQADFANNLFHPQDLQDMRRFADMMRQASKSPKNLTPEKMSRVTEFLATAAPIVGSAGMWALGAIHPALAAVISVPAGLASRYAAIKGGEYAARRAANLPPEIASRGYDFPQVRTAIPLIQQQSGFAKGGSTPSAPALPSSGKVMTAEMMISKSKQARKKRQSQTKAILDQPDEHVVKALKVASDNLQGNDQ